MINKIDANRAEFLTLPETAEEIQEPSHLEPAGNTRPGVDLANLIRCAVKNVRAQQASCENLGKIQSLV